jgi:hypothetical protein
MHDFFKDFASPIATIIAAFAATYVAWRFQSVQAATAKQQADIAKDKLRHDLYDRRYRIFDSLFDYYYAVIKWQKEATVSVAILIGSD